MSRQYQSRSLRRDLSSELRMRNYVSARTRRERDLRDCGVLLRPWSRPTGRQAAPTPDPTRHPRGTGRGTQRPGSHARRLLAGARAPNLKHVNRKRNAGSGPVHEARTSPRAGRTRRSPMRILTARCGGEPRRGARASHGGEPRPANAAPESRFARPIDSARRRGRAGQAKTLLARGELRGGGAALVPHSRLADVIRVRRRPGCGSARACSPTTGCGSTRSRCTSPWRSSRTCASSRARRSGWPRTPRCPSDASRIAPGGSIGLRRRDAQPGPAPACAAHSARTASRSAGELSSSIAVLAMTRAAVSAVSAPRSLPAAAANRCS